MEMVTVTTNGKAMAALFLSTSWEKDSTWQVISEFCGKTQKKTPYEVSAIFCTLLGVEVSDAQKEDAARNGVTLIPATRPIWSNPAEDPPAINWLVSHANYYPDLQKLEDIGHVVALSAKTKNAASAIHDNLFRQAKLHLVNAKPAALFVAHAWNKDDLGLTTFHRTLVKDFCERKDRVGEGLIAYSTVLDVKISDDEKTDAENCGVTLIAAQIQEWSDPKNEVPEWKRLLFHQTYYPDLRELENVQYVVGYAPKTGFAAADIQAKLFPAAKLVLINHACPEQNCLEAEKCGSSEFEDKMLHMASKAHLLLSIGPKIYEYFKNAYRTVFKGKQLSEIPHMEILPNPHSSSFLKDPIEGDVKQHYILTCGQLDVEEAIERCDVMAASIGAAANLRKASHMNPPEWKIQGVSKEVDKTVVKLLSDKMQSPNIMPKLHQGHSVECLLRNLQQSHLCLPAPWYIDYSFYGLEAMVSGLPTAVYEYSHIAHFVMKYFKKHADNSVVRSPEKNMSEVILKHLEDTALAFEKAKDLKTDLENSEVISTSYARFASMLTPVPKETGEGSLAHGTGKCNKALNESRTDDIALQNDEKSKQQPIAFGHEEYGTKKTETQPDKMKTEENKTGKSEATPDSFAVRIELDDNDVQAKVKALPGKWMTEIRSYLLNVWNRCKQALTQRGETVMADTGGCKQVTEICNQQVDGDPITMRAESLGILLRLLTMYHLYKLKQTCRSGSLAKAFEPLLITDEMRKIAAEAGIKLKLKATYNHKAFKNLELFFINRDGGGIQPLRIKGAIQPEGLHVAEIKHSLQETDLVEDNAADISVDDRIHNKEALTLILLELNPGHEIRSSTETNIHSLFKPEKCIRQKGRQFDILQAVMTMTDRVEHILSSRQEILALLGVTRYLITDVESESLSIAELEDKLMQQGKLTLPIIVAYKTLSLQARSLLPIYGTGQQLTDSDIRYLALVQSNVQYLQNQIDMAQSKVHSVQSQLDKSHTEVKSLQSQLDIKNKKFQTTFTEKSLLENRLAEAQNDNSQLQKQFDEYRWLYEKTEKMVSTQLSDIPRQKSSLKEKVKTEPKTELLQLSDAQSDMSDINQQKQLVESLQLGKQSITTEMEEKGTIDSLMDEANTKTKITDSAEDTTLQPKMTVRKGELDLKPRQPGMTGSEGTVMDVTTAMQPLVVEKEAWRKDTALSMELTKASLEENRDVEEKEQVTIETQHHKERKESGGIISRIKLFSGGSDETGGSTVISRSKKQQQGSVTVGSKEFPSGQLSSVMFGGTVTPGSKEKHSGTVKADSGPVSSVKSGCTVTPGSKEKQSGAVKAGSDELPSGPVSSMKSGSTENYGRKEKLSGTVKADSGPVSSMKSGGTVTPGSKGEQSGAVGSETLPSGSVSSKMSGGKVTVRRKKFSGHWSKKIINGHTSQKPEQQKFKVVRGLVFHNDKLLVCDSDNNIVHILNRDYTCGKELGSFSGQFAKPFKPQSIAVSQDNLCFILDKSNVQIVVCDQNNKVIRIISLPTDSKPWCIALVKGFVIVTEVKGHRVLKYSQDGRYVTEIGGHNSDGGTQFRYPFFVAVNSRNVIMVSDSGNNCIKCFDSEFNYLYKYSQFRHGDVQLFYPRSIAVDGTDSVYVCDQINARISMWSTDGKWRRHLFQGEVFEPRYMAVTADGDRIAVVSAWSKSHDEIVVFSK